jgi:peptidoglycan hydrolase-like protein with peptidoglycan-binding domain
MAQVTVSLDTIDLRSANEFLVRGRHVDNLQGLLAGTRVPRFSPGPIDGLGGARTLTAVLAFQSAQGLAADAIVGPRTWSALVPFAGGT